MSAPAGPPTLAEEQDFDLGALRICPSVCRVLAGQDEVRVEAKTMLVLIVLARADGGTVSRDELIELCWEGRVVTDDAVARTIAKVRVLARSLSPAPFVIETVPKVGYRLLRSNAVAASPSVADEVIIDQAEILPPMPQKQSRRWGTVALVAMGMIAIPLMWSLFPKTAMGSPPQPNSVLGEPSPRAPEISDALWTLDEPRLREYLQRGWDPNWLLDSEGNAALHSLLLVCERNRTHDQAGLIRIAQFLVAAGANPTTRNKWGDTPLMIAIEPKYCGPAHPVVEYLRAAGAAKD